MNPNPPTPPSVPMVKNETVKDDGRLLIYYSFPAQAAPAEMPEKADRHMEDADV